MKFKVGDKVKFLNEKGGGIVSKIISPGLVNVAIEDGFEIPTKTSELLKIDLEAPVDSPKHLFSEDFNVSLDLQRQNSSGIDERNQKLLNNPSQGLLSPGVYLAFVPQDQKWLVTGMLDVNLVNHTGYDILYSVFLEGEKAGYTGFDYGSVAPESMVLIDSIDRDQLGRWSKGVVQVLFHKDEDIKILSPGSAAFKVKASRFYNENSYKSSSVMSGKAVMVSLLPLSAQISIFNSQDVAKGTNSEAVVSEAKELEPEHIIDKYKTSPFEAVVDLHIEQLVEDYSGLDNSGMLTIQLNHFTRCLESAIVNKVRKVVFIHGVGTGVLKNAIKEKLKDYENIHYRDASMMQFGYGATEVILKY